MQFSRVSVLQQQYIYKEFGSHLIPLQFVQSLKGDNHYTNESMPVIIIIIIITDIHPQLVESEQQDAHEFLILFIGYLLSKLPSRYSCKEILCEKCMFVNCFHNLI